MRRTSTDRRAIGFARLSVAVIALLALLAIGLGTLSALRGPHLRAAEVDPARASIESHQRLVLRTDQLLAAVDAERVRIEPAVDVRVSTVDTSVVIEFRTALAAATEFHVQLDVVGLHTGIERTLETRFATPPIALARLDRDLEGLDRVVRAQLGGPEPQEEVLLEAPRIQEYAVAGDRVLAVSLDAANRPTLVERRDGALAEFDGAPAAERYRLLRANAAGTALGFVADGIEPTGDARPGDEGTGDEGTGDQGPGTGTDGTDHGIADASSGNGRLYVIDAATGETTAVEGFGGEVVTWGFVPRTASVLVQTVDGQVHVVDPLGGRPTIPLGQHDSILGFVLHEIRALIQDGTTYTLVDLLTGERTEAQPPRPDAPEDAFSGRVVPLAEGVYAQSFHVSAVAPASAGPRSRLYVMADDRVELIAAPDDGWIGAVCPSPNGEFLALQRSPENPSVDGYPLLPGIVGARVDVVRIDSGETVASLPGMLPSWCAA